MPREARAAGPALDEREPRPLRRHEPRSETQFRTQPDAVRLLDQQGIGATIDRVAIDFLAQHHAAGTWPRFEDDKGHRRSRQLVSGRQPGNPSANHDDVEPLHRSISFYREPLYGYHRGRGGRGG